MRKDRLAIFCTEARREIGYGHLMECLYLSEYLLQKGLSIKFYINDDVQAKNFLEGRGISNEVTEGVPQLEKVLLRDKPCICIFNLRAISVDLQEVARHLDVKIAVIDELGNKDILADVLINGSVIEEWHHYSYCNTNPLSLFGPKYIIMRQKFQEYHTKKKIFSQKSVLVTMGGVDRTSTTLKIVKVLKTLTKTKKRIVIGPGFAHKEKLNKISNDLDNSYELIYSPNNMAELLYTSDIAFTAGGNTLYEAACVGTPAIVLWEDEHEGMQAEWFDHEGVTLDRGRGAQVDMEDIRKTTEDLLCDEKKKLQMSHKGKYVVDGRGIERIGEILCKLIQK